MKGAHLATLHAGTPLLRKGEFGRVAPLDDDAVYPASDGKPMAETQIHILLLTNLYAMLRYHFRSKMDRYFFGANLFLYYRQGLPKFRRAPDLMAVKGVDGRQMRRSFKTWVEKAVPCFILELTSKETAQEDQKDKKQVYQELGVKEYFLFDPLHDYLPEPLMGYRLVEREYQPIVGQKPDELVSEELDLRFVADGQNLLVFDRGSGRRLLTPAEAFEAAESVDKMRKQNKAMAAKLKRLRGKSAKKGK
jgi:Uma2 family endonuclease